MIDMIIIKNGMLVSPTGSHQADLAMQEGVIARIAESIDAAAGDQVVDATGCWVFPGFIDAHTHLDADIGTLTTSDTFATGTRAGVCGGTTSVVDFATQDRGMTLADALEAWHGKADGVSSANYAFHLAITDWNEATKAEIVPVRQAGITSFKCYLAYDALKVDGGELLDVLQAIKPFGGMMGVHCEIGEIIDELQAHELACGHTTPAAHPRSRPAEAEAAAIDEYCWIARLADLPVNVVHLSSALGLEAIRRARGRGQRVYVETCPQYLLLDEQNYLREGFEGAKYVMSPPLRRRADIEVLRQAVRDGEIDTISTDHCAFTFGEQKHVGVNDFTKIPNGAPGIEHRPSLMFTLFGTEVGRERLCALLSENQARIFGMYPRKGVLREGSDADVTVWDPAVRWTISAANQHQNVDYTPYEGFEVEGRPRFVYVNGQLAARDGEPTGTVAGAYIKR